MDSFGLDVCEICGTHSADHAGWFSVAGHGAQMEVVLWNEELHARSDWRHACCGDHIEQLVLSAATGDLRAPMFALATEHGGWNPASLVPPVKSDTSDEGESLLSVLSAVDSILQIPSDDEEEDERTFDA